MMMKKLIYSLSILCFLMNSSCREPKHIMKENFNVNIEGTSNSIDILDGFYERVYADTSLTINMKFSSAEITSIFDFIASKDILDFPNNYEPITFDSTLPKSYTKVEVVNGSQKKILIISNSNYPFFNSEKVESVRGLIQLIENKCYERKEVKKMKQSDLILE